MLDVLKYTGHNEVHSLAVATHGVPFGVSCHHSADERHDVWLLIVALHLCRTNFLYHLFREGTIEIKLNLMKVGIRVILQLTQ